MRSEATVLIVDDEPINLIVLTSLLQPEYRLRAANSGDAALHAVATPPRPDLILMDVMMPGMDGYEVLERLRAKPSTADIPVIFLTGLADESEEERGLRLGAADYLTKPIRPALVRARVRTQLEAKRARDMMRDRNAFLEAEVARRMEENDLTQLASIRALAHIAETRDDDTGRHILRTQRFVREIAERLRGHPRFAGFLDAPTVALLERSAPLHDIGKVGIPDSILHKPGPLTPDERAVMETHAALGAEALERAEADLPRQVAFLPMARQIARWHHERWDGRGYPDGLRGDEIPIPARLMALADVFDALISPRVYKPPMDYEVARDVIAGARGTQFDPDVVDAFLEGFTAFVAIAEHNSDTP